MKTFGILYGDIIKYNIIGKKPLFEKGWSQETEEPFRKGDCVVLRIPFTKTAVALGIWGKPAIDPDKAMMEALNAFRQPSDFTVEDIRAW